jgi:nucleobase:cation symporter-1, NCS1 family
MATLSPPAPRTEPTEVPVSLTTPEVHSIDFIPDRERHGTVRQQGVFWFLSNAQTLSVAVGFTGITLGLSVWTTILAVVVGNAFGTVFMALHASQGPRLGLPQMIQSRAQFGYRGVVLPLAMALFTYLIFMVIDVVILKEGFQGLFGISPTLTGIIVCVIGFALAIYGYDWLHLAFKVLFWISLPFWLALSAAIVFGDVNGKAAPHSHFGWIAFIGVFAYSASINISYAPVISDYSRYLPRNTPYRSVIGSVFAGGFWSLTWMAAIGTWLAAHLGATDALVGVHAAGNNIFHGFGTIIVILAALALIATMGEMVYSSQLVILTGLDSFKQLKPTFRKRALAASVFTVVCLVLGTWVFTSQWTAIDDGLSLSLYVLTPWTIVNLIDYFLVRRGKYAIVELENRDGLYGVWGWRGISAYVIGFAASVPFWNLSFYESPFAKSNSDLDISFIVELVVAGVVYLITSRSIDLRRDARAAQESEDKLVAAGLISKSIHESAL